MLSPRTPWTAWLLGAVLVLGSLALTLWIEPTDVAEYARYAHEALLSPLLTHWPVEYPTFSQGVFLLPRLLPLPYYWAFGLLAGCAFLTLMAIRAADSAWNFRLLIYFGLGALGVLVGRYDIYAVLAAVLGIEAARRHRFRWAWFWLAAGFLLKLYPACFFPVLFFWQYRREGRWPWQELLITLLAIFLIIEVEYRWAGPGALAPYQFLRYRPMEIGSFPGDIAAFLSPYHTRIAFAFGAMNIFTPLNHVLGVVFTVLMALSFLAIMAAVYADYLDYTKATLLSLVALLLTSKIFSVQFVMWLIPLWCYFPLNAYWVAAAGLSTVAYPFAYLFAIHHPSSWWILIVLYGLRSVAVLLGTKSALTRRQYPNRRYFQG